MSQTDKKKASSSPSEEEGSKKRKPVDADLTGWSEKKQKLALDEKSSGPSTDVQPKKRTPAEEKALLLLMREEQLKKLERAKGEVEKARDVLEEKNADVKSIETVIKHQDNQIYGTELKQFFLNKKPDEPKRAYFMGPWFESMKGSMIKKLSSEGRLIKLSNALTINYLKRERDEEEEEEKGVGSPEFELDESAYEGVPFKRDLEAMTGIKVVLDDLKVSDLPRNERNEKKGDKKETEEEEEEHDDDDDDDNFVVSDGDDDDDETYEEEEEDEKGQKASSSSKKPTARKVKREKKSLSKLKKQKKKMQDDLEDDFDKEEVYDMLFSGLSIANRRKIEVDLAKFVKKGGVQQASFRFWNYNPEKTLGKDHDFESSALSQDESDMSFADFFPVTVLIM